MTRRGLGCVLVLLLGLLAAGALGQEGRPPKSNGPAPQPTPAVEADFTLSVDFPGGTVGQYIDGLKKAAGKNAVNVVASRQAMEVPVAPISLREVSLYAALSAVQGAAGRETRWDVRPLGLSPSKNAEAWALEMQPNPAQIAMPMPGGMSQRAQPEGGIRVFSLRDLTEPLPGDPPGVPLTKSPEVVLTAVRAALDLAGERGGEAPELKFHEDSGLLIVHGSNEQVGAVMQTLDQMRDDVRRRRDAAKLSMQPRADVDQLRSELQKAEVVRSQATRDMDRCKRGLEQARLRMDAGQASHAEVLEQEAKADEAEARAQMANIDMGRLKKMIEDAQNAGRVGSPEVRAQGLQAQIDQTSEVIANTQQVYSDAIKKGDEAGAAGAKQQVDRLEAQREALRAELRKLTSGEGGSGGGTPQGKSVAVYDVGDMGAKAREQLISSIRALETAINNPEKLKIQSIQGESKLVIEADGAMHAVVRGMCKEVSGARGEPGKADGKPKPRGK